MGGRTTVDTPLTVKQTKFAALVANGKSKAQAHREVYVSQREPRAQQRRALETAARPNVAAEIKRLTWLSFPPLDDTRGMREQAVRILADLSRSAESEEVRLKSALALYKIAETTEAARDPNRSDAEQDRMLSALRKLYNQIQGVTPATITVAAESDSDALAPDEAE